MRPYTYWIFKDELFRVSNVSLESCSMIHLWLRFQVNRSKFLRIFTDGMLFLRIDQSFCRFSSMIHHRPRFLLIDQSFSRLANDWMHDHRLLALLTQPPIKAIWDESKTFGLCLLFSRVRCILKGVVIVLVAFRMEWNWRKSEICSYFPFVQT